MKNAIRSASNIHHKKVLVLVLRYKVLVLNTKAWSWYLFIYYKIVH